MKTPFILSPVSLQLTTTGVLHNEQPQRHPAKPYHWKRGGGQKERGGTSKHSGGSERHPPTSPRPLTKLSGLSRAHAGLEHIFLKSFTPDNVQKPAAN